MQPLTPPTAAPRLPIIDLLRGLAIVQMVVYHFIYDLSYFRWLTLAMNRDQPWITWRAAIVTQFLLLVGVSLVLRTTFKPGAADFWRRWLQVAGAAALVSIGSALMFGERFIFFGILHFVAAALILLRPTLPLGAWLVVPGVMAIAAGVLIRDDFFMQSGWNLLGFGSRKPRTEDWVPLFPWLGVVLVGAGLAALWRAGDWRVPATLAPLNQAAPGVRRWLVWIGQWPLTIYLLHQPVLIGVLWLIRQMG